MARLYHRDQPGAPALTYAQANNTGPIHFEAFKTILKACLVSGYGAYPAAGWELVYESALALVLRNGTRSGYVCFQRHSTTATVLTVWLAATYTGVDANGKILGSGVRSGTAAGSSLPQRYSVYHLAGYTASATWSLVADAGTFVFSPSGASGVEVVTANSGSGWDAITPLYCGDDSAGDFICVGGQGTTSTGITSNYHGFGPAGFTALKYPDSGLLVDAAAIALSMPGSRSPGVLAGEHPAGLVLPEVSLSPLIWVSGAVVRRLRGLVTDQKIAHMNQGAAGQALGGPVLTTRTMNTELVLGDGHVYLVARNYGGTHPVMLMTANPEFW